MNIKLFLAAPLLLFIGCEIGAKSDGADSGADSGRDVDPGDGGGGSGGGGGVDCEGVDASAPTGPACISGVIACGETIEATTEGGTDILNEDFYDSATCFVTYQGYESAERIYELEFDGRGDEMIIDIVMDAPCGDLALSAWPWSDPTTCPEGTQHNVYYCDGLGASSGAALALYSTGEDPERYLISVDGDVEAAFKLSVTCSQ